MEINSYTVSEAEWEVYCCIIPLPQNSHALRTCKYTLLRKSSLSKCPMTEDIKVRPHWVRVGQISMIMPLSRPGNFDTKGHLEDPALFRWRQSHKDVSSNQGIP